MCVCVCVCVWKSHNESEQKVKSQMFLRNSSLKVSSLPSWAVACTSTQQQGKEMQREELMKGIDEGKLMKGREERRKKKIGKDGEKGKEGKKRRERVSV